MDTTMEHPNKLQGAQLKEFALAGNATFTVENTATHNRFTFKVRQPQPDTPHFVKVLAGTDNTGDYTYVGAIFRGREFRLTSGSKVTHDAPCAKAFAWLWQHVQAGHALPATVEVHHEGHCGRCGRTLTVPDSIKSGIGPECAKRMGVA